MPDKIFTMAEVKKHKSGKSVLMVIHNDVYDVTKFMRNHPGGENAIKEYAGKDATQAFEDVGHSEDARAILNTLKVGSLPPEERKIHTTTCHRSIVSKKSSTRMSKRDILRLFPAVGRRNPSKVVLPKDSNRWKYVLLALAVIGVGAFAYKKMQG